MRAHGTKVVLVAGQSQIKPTYALVKLIVVPSGPDADGLLGRNELKLRLKRKAKKQRLVGPRHADEADDGVRTGWVCVNVGEVTPGTEAEAVEEKKEFVGFGKRSDGVKVVYRCLSKRREKS